MNFKYLKSIFYTLFSYLLFIAFLSIAQEDKIEVSLDECFPESILENFHKVICQEMNFLKNNNLKNALLDSTLDSAIDFHIYIYLLKNEINKKKHFFKADLEGLISYISKIKDIILLNQTTYNNCKDQTINIILSKAIDKLKTLEL